MLTAIRTAVLVLACSWVGNAASVVLVGGRTDLLRLQVILAARFYGLDVKEITGNYPEQTRRVVEAAQHDDTSAVIVEAYTLSSLDLMKVSLALRRPGGQRAPLLIVHSGTPGESTSVVKWSSRLASDCTARVDDSDEWELRVRQSAIAPQLAEVTLPFRGRVSCQIKLGDAFSGRVLIEASNRQNKFPVFVNFSCNGQDLFLLAGLYPTFGSSSQGRSRLIDAFSNIAPVLMFLRYAAGDQAWHTVGRYANLTIDDPWLIEPYGNLAYRALSMEMAKHNFHTTIALIPWNFDRSRTDAVTLFRSSPDKFSVAIHGNNHDHREFGDYINAPLVGQTQSIKQALARMDHFSRSTGIPYDPVMIFPHAVAPAQTFAMLKRANYWFTANSENVPLGSNEPRDPLFLLRPQTLAFENFLSIKRHSAEVPISRTALAINAYLGNPLLFYVHQEFFSRGIGAFNEIADSVNRIAPDTEWRNLGAISQHLYLLRRRQDQNYDVIAFSPNFYLMNLQNRPVVFHIRRAENFIPPIHSLRVDGSKVPYQALKDEIVFEVSVASGQTRHIHIAYVDDMDIAHADISRKNIRVNILRRLSDFRDMTLSTSHFGRKLTSFYSGYRLNILESRLEKSIAPILILGIVCLFGQSLYRRRKRFTGREK